MSAPTIIVEGGLKIRGRGLALVAMTIEQDAAYWEFHIERDGSSSIKRPTNDSNNYNNHSTGSSDDSDEDGEGESLKFGVATRKDRRFYHAHESSADEGALTGLNACTVIVDPAFFYTDDLLYYKT